MVHVNYINNIIGESIVDHPKTFWSYLKLMRTENIGIPVLRTALNQHFQSVFTPTSRDPIPDKGPSPLPDIPNLIIHQEGMFK